MSEIVLAHMPEIWRAAVATLFLSAATVILSTPLALLVAVLREFGPRVLRVPLAVFVNLTRAAPVLVILYFSYYGLPRFGFYLAPIVAALLGLVLSTVAFMSEDFRGALQAVPRGQWQAAQALGLRFHHQFLLVILPQAVPSIIPLYISRAIMIVKATSVASLVAVNELSGTAYALIAQTYRALEFLTVAAVFYLAINAVLAGVQYWAEGRLARRSRR